MCSHQSTGSHRPYDVGETRRPTRMREDIQEHQHAGLYREELRAKGRSQSMEQTICLQGTHLNTREPSLTSANGPCGQAERWWARNNTYLMHSRSRKLGFQRSCLQSNSTYHTPKALSALAPGLALLHVISPLVPTWQT